MARTRRHTDDKWAIVERLQAVALDGAPCEAALAATAANLITERLPAPSAFRGIEVDRYHCAACGALSDALEDGVRVCWPCRRTWRDVR